MVAYDSIQFYLDGREIIHQPRVPDGWSYVKAICHHRWGVPPSTVLVRKVVLDEVGGFDPEQRVGEDGDLHRRISWCHTIHQMDEVLTRYRIGHTSLSQNRREANRYERRYYVKMLRDTSPDLRWAVPSAASLMRRWLLRVVLPKWIRHPRKQLLRASGRLIARYAQRGAATSAIETRDAALARRRRRRREKSRIVQSMTSRRQVRRRS
jgi:hypothetical protein